MSDAFPTPRQGEIQRNEWVPTAGQPAVPVLLASGARPGPNVVITGGVHGDEYEGPSAIYRLFNELDPVRISGTVIGLPIVNIAAWNARTRTSPTDGADLNRAFPGQPGTPSATLAEAVFNKAVKPCDILLDLHSGGRALVHLPLIGWYEGSSESETLARRFNPDLHPWLIPEASGVLSCEANRIGKIALGAEWGGGASLDLRGAAAYCTGIKNLLAQLNVLPIIEAIVEPDARPAIAGDYQQSVEAGLFHPTATLGDPIQENEKLGMLTAISGQSTEEVLAQRSGIIAGLPHQPWIQPGDRIAYIG